MYTGLLTAVFFQAQASMRGRSAAAMCTVRIHASCNQVLIYASSVQIAALPPAAG